MRTMSVFLLGSLLPAGAHAQSVVDHSKARSYVNEEVTIEGPVARVDRSGRALWFSLGKPNPSATVVIVVSSEFSSAYPDPRSWEGATVRVRGRVLSADQEGIGIERTGSRMSGPKPRGPFIILEDPSRMTIVTPAKPKEP